MSDIDFLKQAAIAAMQAMIQARAVTEATAARNQATHMCTGRDNPYEVDDEIFTHSVYSGVQSQINLGKEEGGKYTWGELVAEEAFEIAECMGEQLKKRGHA